MLLFLMMSHASVLLCESPLQYNIRVLLKRCVVCQCSKCNGLHYGLNCMPPFAAVQTIQKGDVQAQLIRFACTEAAAAAMLSNIVVCHRELGFTPVEVNASDTRNKADNSALKGVGAKLANSIKELATNTAIGAGADHKPKKVSPQALLHSVFG